MTHILLLRTYPDMRAAVAAINDLSDAFVKAHKRKSGVQLMVASTSGPYDRVARKFRGPEVIEVRVHHTTEQLADAQWFAREANR